MYGAGRCRSTAAIWKITREYYLLRCSDKMAIRWCCWLCLQEKKEILHAFQSLFCADSEPYGTIAEPSTMHWDAQCASYERSVQDQLLSSSWRSKPEAWLTINVPVALSVLEFLGLDRTAAVSQFFQLRTRLVANWVSRPQAVKAKVRSWSQLALSGQSFMIRCLLEPVRQGRPYIESRQSADTMDTPQDCDNRR